MEKYLSKQKTNICISILCYFFLGCPFVWEPGCDTILLINRTSDTLGYFYKNNEELSIYDSIGSIFESYYIREVSKHETLSFIAKNRYILPKDSQNIYLDHLEHFLNKDCPDKEIKIFIFKTGILKKFIWKDVIVNRSLYKIYGINAKQLDSLNYKINIYD